MCDVSAQTSDAALAVLIAVTASIMVVLWLVFHIEAKHAKGRQASQAIRGTSLGAAAENSTAQLPSEAPQATVLEISGDIASVDVPAAAEQLEVVPEVLGVPSHAIAPGTDEDEKKSSYSV